MHGFAVLEFADGAAVGHGAPVRRLDPHQFPPMRAGRRPASCDGMRVRPTFAHVGKRANLTPSRTRIEAIELVEHFFSLRKRVVGRLGSAV